MARLVASAEDGSEHPIARAIVTGLATERVVPSVPVEFMNDQGRGVDATVATGMLGLFWGAVYLRRRSCVAPIVSHAGFDLMQIVPFLGLR